MPDAEVRSPRYRRVLAPAQTGYAFAVLAGPARLHLLQLPGG